MKTTRFLIVACVSLAISFMFSCSSGGDGCTGDDCYAGVSSPGGGVSSSSGGGSSSPSGGKGNDIASYETVNIGGKMWMAENLDYAVEGSKCYDNDPANCVKYGRLYNWATAMALDASCNSSTCSNQIQTKHRGICPEGWHIPSNADWNELYHYADGTANTSSNYDSPTAGKHLKAKDGWNSNGNGEDTYGFAALPGGYGDSGGFYNVGSSGSWWSSSEYDSSDAYYRYMYYNHEYAIWNFSSKDYRLFSVRCVHD